MSLPESLSKDLNSKYRECQKLVDFLKHLGYKSDINLNNILFPSARDMQKIFEFTMEYTTNIDNAALDYEQNFSDKNYTRMKISKQLGNWCKEAWIIPELKFSKEIAGSIKESNSFRSIQILKLEKQKLNIMKKKINAMNIQIPENSKYSLIYILVINISRNKAEELLNDERLNIITEDEFKVVGITTLGSNNNKTIEQLRRKIKGMYV